MLGGDLDRRRPSIRRPELVDRRVGEPDEDPHHARRTGLGEDARAKGFSHARMCPPRPRIDLPRHVAPA